MADNFNDNLKTAHERKGFSQKEMAEKIGIASLHIPYMKAAIANQIFGQSKKLQAH